MSGFSKFVLAVGVIALLVYFGVQAVEKGVSDALSSATG